VSNEDKAAIRRSKNNAYKKALRLRRIAAGLCKDCSSPAKRTLCPGCMSDAVARKRKCAAAKTRVSSDGNSRVEYG
jgi:predicted amidophosphoribosyltransferase